MNKPLSDWTVADMLAFFEKHELTPQQIIPVVGSGDLNMTIMAHNRECADIEERYHNIAKELVVIITEDLCHRMA